VQRQRVRDERGAVGVVVAMLMTAVMGFAAVSIDVAALWNQKQQLQTGADAGALAIAQDCALGVDVLRCGDPLQTAQDMATANMTSADCTGAEPGECTATATIAELTSSSVTVRNSGEREYWFAPVLDPEFESARIDTQATAAWGAPTRGTAALPLIFSHCEFLAQTGGGLPSAITERTIHLTKSSNVDGCTGPSNNVVPGGFGWIDSDPDTCNATTAVNGLFYSDPGNDVPSSCSLSDLVSLHGQTVLLPIFDEAYDSGNNASYRVHGYAAFVITGYHLGGQYSWNEPCSRNERCIHGYFTKFSGMSDDFEFDTGDSDGEDEEDEEDEDEEDAPNLGALIVALTD